MTTTEKKPIFINYTPYLNRLSPIKMKLLGADENYGACFLHTVFIIRNNKFSCIFLL